jgi:hypothetical protein
MARSRIRAWSQGQLIVLIAAILFAAIVSFGSYRHLEGIIADFTVKLANCPGSAHPLGAGGDIDWCYDHLYRPRITARSQSNVALGVSIILPFLGLMILWVRFGDRGKLGAVSPDGS